MKMIPLSTRGWKNLGRYVAVVDVEDYDYLSEFQWRVLVHGRAPNMRIYAVRRTAKDGKPYDERMHRVVWQRANGVIPESMEIDHIEPGEHGGLDNRRGNLRLTDKARNQANSRKSSNNTSGFKGVWWQRQARKWRADLVVGGKKRHLGYFDDKCDAARAYDAAATAAFGEHARLNFPHGAAR